MGDLKVRSTSKATAKCSDFIIRETRTTRLIFRPLLIDNPKNPSASVKGVFLYQRKGAKQIWADFPTEPLSGLKSGESYKLSLSSSETLALCKHIEKLQDLFACNGIQYGQTEYVKVNQDISKIVQLPLGKLRQYLDADKKVGTELLTRLLDWSASVQNLSEIVSLLVKLGPESIRKLNTAVGIQSLKSAYNLWRQNSDNSDEEFWQKTLTEHSFVLEYVFSWPCSIVKEKAYVGGKTVTNTGGKIVDFLMKNEMTSNAALIEIKTPKTPLLGREYRQGVNNISEDLSGSVLQVLAYKQSLIEHYHSLTQGQMELFNAFDPKTVVIIGNTEISLQNSKDRKSFELFRNQFNNVAIITFDELFKKTGKLIGILENVSIETEDDDDDIPF
jgi:hypothetical protein